MAQAPDPYRTLGVKRDATDADVKAAHRRLAKRFHPDAGSGDRDRFLRVQEAYRVLSDPLLRKEWDAQHTPGPIRADRQPPAPRQRAARRQPAAARDERPPAEERPKTDQRPPAARPRSKKAYTWSASEVPWWEEGSSTTNRRQPVRRRPQEGPGPTAADADPADPTPPSSAANEPPNAFDVYNRSSGAAWSMAARAYFRRGEQELPRRGTFRYEGTQVVTGGRARTAADAEARRRQADLRHQAAAATAQASAPPSSFGTAAGANSTRSAHPQSAHGTPGVASPLRPVPSRRLQQAWPTIIERLVYALVAWIPISVLIGYGGAVATGCDRAFVGCPQYLETGQAIGIALALGLLVALPKVAYIGTWATIGTLIVGVPLVAVFALTDVATPLSIELNVLVGIILVSAYLVSAAIVVARGGERRPWALRQAAGVTR